VTRYVPHSAADQKALLTAVKKHSIQDLFADLPGKARIQGELKLPPALSEIELLAELKAQSAGNKPAASFLGGGNYQHFIPSVVKALAGRAEFLTAYTPYQAEASQGALQAIYEYQGLICALTGLDAANASLYDGATALAEAAFLACRATGRKKIAVSAAVNPNYHQVLRTYANGAGLELVETFSPDCACYLLQQPNFFGCLEPISGLAEKIHAGGGLFIVSVDPISLGLLKAPGEYGADVAVGEGQSLGNSQNFGGPGLGFMAVKKALLRQMPGRIVGQTVDHDGRRAFCLTLQAREQHIRRERATSNICSNEAHCALTATIYLAVMGKQGLRQVAELCLQKANYVKKALKNKLVFPAPTFKEFAIKSDQPVGLDLGGGRRLICVTELATRAELDQLISRLASS
jgi:glycine dehydrogenase subunit 1